MQPDLTKTQRRAIQYFYIDGTFEFTFGGLCLFLAGFFLLQSAVPDNLSGNLFNLALMVVIPLSAMLINRLIGHFKEQVTYPRTGYVAYQSAQGSQRRVRLALKFGVAFLVGGGVALFVSRTPQSLDWMSALTALVFGMVLVFIGLRSGLIRFYALGLLVGVTGLGLAWLGYGDIPGLARFYGLTSLILFASGGMTLRSYLRHNPPSDEAADES